MGSGLSEVKFTKVQDAPVVRIKSVDIELLEVIEAEPDVTEQINDYYNREVLVDCE